MNGFDALFEFIRHNLLQSLFFFVIAVSVLRRIVKQASEDQARRNAGAPPAMTGPEDELRERVRRGFEEMMRQRAAAAAKGPPKGSAADAPSVAPRVPQRIAAKAPPNRPRVPERAPAIAPAPRPDLVSAQAAAARTLKLAREKLATRRAPPPVPSIARRLLQDRSAVRRAFLLREILDVPRSLRTGS